MTSMAISDMTCAADLIERESCEENQGREGLLRHMFRKKPLNKCLAN